MSRLGEVIQKEFDDCESFEFEMDMHEFVAWLVEVDEIAGISVRQMESLVLEYCLFHNRRPISPAKRRTMHRAVGIESDRPCTRVTCEKTGRRIELRPTIYRVRPDIVFTHDMRQAA